MHLPYLADRASVTDAEELIARHGEAAAIEAARRAGRSRTVGNHIHFCRWRQIERLIHVLDGPAPEGLLH
jgi:hypothetical protein